jgi:hypothetical protein
MTVHVPSVEVVRQMSATDFVAFAADLSLAEMDAWTKKLFAGRREDDEALCAKYRALADDRCKQLHEIRSLKMTHEASPNGVEKQAVAQEINRFLGLFRGLTDISEKLADVGHLEQSAAAAEARLAKVRTAAAELKAAQEKAEVLVADAKSESDEILEAAKASAKQLLDTAHAEIREAKEKAKAHCDEHEAKALQAKHAAADAVGRKRLPSMTTSRR